MSGDEYGAALCVAGCPVTEVEGEYNPRKLIRMILLGMKEEVLSSNLIWLCSLCYTCYARCPQNVKFTDIMGVLRDMGVRGKYVDASLVKSIDEQPKKPEESQKDEPSTGQTEQIEKETQIFKGKGRILVLDDEKTILDVAHKMLSRLGYEVSGAIFLEQAIEMYRESIRKGRKYNAVILDLSELGGSEGYGLKLWKEVDPDVKAIISSGYADDPIFENYKNYGIKAALKKPYDIAQLSKILYEVLKSK